MFGWELEPTLNVSVHSLKTRNLSKQTKICSRWQQTRYHAKKAQCCHQLVLRKQRPSLFPCTHCFISVYSRGVSYSFKKGATSVLWKWFGHTNHVLCAKATVRTKLTLPPQTEATLVILPITNIKIGLGLDGQRLALICYPWLHFTILGKKIISSVETGESQKSPEESSKALLSCKPEVFFSVFCHILKKVLDIQGHITYL